MRSFSVGPRRLNLATERARWTGNVSPCPARVERGFHIVPGGNLGLPLGPFHSPSLRALMVEFEFKTLEGGVLATLVGGDGSHRLNLSVDGAKVEGNPFRSLR